MIKKLLRNCQICKNETGILIHTQDFLLEKDNPLPRSYDIVSCTQCGFIFADTGVTQKIYDEYYKQFSKYEDSEISSGSGGNKFDDIRLEKTAHCIKNYLGSTTKSILDIGSGKGGLLLKLKKLGFSNLSALDPSIKCVNHIKNQGIEAQSGSILDNVDNHFDGEKFDLIILSHVLEHIYDLASAVQNITKLLSQSGSVYIEVPDSKRYNDYSILPYYYFDIEHINHFTMRSLTALMMNFGYSPEVSENKNIKVSDKIVYPAFYAFYRNNKSEDISFIRKFIEYSEKSISIERTIDSIVLRKEPIVIWGAGNFTKRLFATTNLDQASVYCFIDKDKNKQGKYLNDIEIKSPEILHGFDGLVVIASALYADEIFKEVMSKYPRKEIIKLEII